MISAIREGFKQPSFEAYENMESLIGKTIASEDASKETFYLRQIMVQKSISIDFQQLKSTYFESYSQSRNLTVFGTYFMK